MKAVLEPLAGKYEGTQITVTYNDGFSDEFFTVKCEGHGKPSSRQLSFWKITQEQWDNNEIVNTSKGKMRARDIRTSNFYETREGFLRAVATAKALNNV